MFKHYTTVIKKYTDFSGRARRAEFWLFTLANTIISAILQIVIIATASTNETISGITGIIAILYALFIFIPSLAVTVRRLHDSGKSGWWIFINLIPLIGGIWHFINLVLDSEQGDNKYGPNPKLQNNSTGNNKYNPNPPQQTQ